MYLHSKGVVHRVIKLDHIFVENCSDSLEFLVKLDGLEDSIVRTNAYEKVTEPPRISHFNAPEMYNKSYTDKADVWSLGMIFYFLLFGSLPFPQETYDLVNMWVLIPL